MEIMSAACKSGSHRTTTFLPASGRFTMPVAPARYKGYTIGFHVAPVVWNVILSCRAPAFSGIATGYRKQRQIVLVSAISCLSAPCLEGVLRLQCRTGNEARAFCGVNVRLGLVRHHGRVRCKLRVQHAPHRQQRNTAMLQGIGAASMGRSCQFYTRCWKVGHHGPEQAQLCCCIPKTAAGHD